MARSAAAACVCGAMLIGLISACATSTSRAEGSNPAKTPHAAEPSKGSTPSSTPTNNLGATPGPVNRPTAKVSKLIARLTPSQFALNKSGYLLITYSDEVNGIASAWRLYGPHDKVIAEGREGAGPTVAATGFLLHQGPVSFVDRRGRLTKVTYRVHDRRPIGPGDTPIPELGAFNLRTKEVFLGTAVPDGVVTLVDGRGRYWALGKHTGDRTVVRVARPGGTWKSRDLGPRIGARQVTGAGNLIMVTGRSKVYLSPDAGKTWRLLRHGATAYSGMPVFFVATDGSIVTGDERAGFRISYDLKTFQDATREEAMAASPYVMTRGRGATTQMSVDGVHWERFTIPGVRRLLSSTSR